MELRSKINPEEAVEFFLQFSFENVYTCHDSKKTFFLTLAPTQADHVRVESSSCFPRVLVSFDAWHVARSPPIGKRICVVRYMYITTTLCYVSGNENANKRDSKPRKRHLKRLRIVFSRKQIIPPCSRCTVRLKYQVTKLVRTVTNSCCR